MLPLAVSFGCPLPPSRSLLPAVLGEVPANAGDLFRVRPITLGETD